MLQAKMKMKATMLLKTSHRPTVARRLGRAGPWPRMAMPQAKMEMKATMLLKTKHRATVARASRPCRAMAKDSHATVKRPILAQPGHALSGRVQR